MTDIADSEPRYLYYYVRISRTFGRSRGTVFSDIECDAACIGFFNDSWSGYGREIVPYHVAYPQAFREVEKRWKDWVRTVYGPYAGCSVVATNKGQYDEFVLDCKEFDSQWSLSDDTSTKRHL